MFDKQTIKGYTIVEFIHLSLIFLSSSDLLKSPSSAATGCFGHLYSYMFF